MNDLIRFGEFFLECRENDRAVKTRMTEGFVARDRQGVYENWTQILNYNIGLVSLGKFVKFRSFTFLSVHWHANVSIR